MADAGSVRKVKVYTKTGDKGTSSLYNGKRRDKSDAIFVALGDTDELNAALGVAREFLAAEPAGEALGEQLANIQSRLLDIGSVIATPAASSSPEQLARVSFDAEHVEALEGWIDAMEEHLPPLRNFILPSGGLGSAHLHVARATCRRAERALVAVADAGEAAATAQRFLNRLSDYLFVAARFAAQAAGVPEQVYQKGVGVTGSSAEAKAARAAAAQ